MNRLKLLVRLSLLILPAIFTENIYCQEMPQQLNGVPPGSLFFELSVTEELIYSGESYEIYFLPTRPINFAMAFFDDNGARIKESVNNLFFSENWKSFKPGNYKLSIFSLETEPLIKVVYAAGMATKKTKPVIRKKSTNVCPPKGRKDFNVHYVLNLQASVESNIISETTSKVIWYVNLGRKPPGTNTFVWDGKQKNGKHADPGDYKLKIKATDVNDKTNVQYDISRVIEVNPVTP